MGLKLSYNGSNSQKLLKTVETVLMSLFVINKHHDKSRC